MRTKPGRARILSMDIRVTTSEWSFLGDFKEAPQRTYPSGPASRKDLFIKRKGGGRHIKREDQQVPGPQTQDSHQVIARGTKERGRLRKQYPVRTGHQEGRTEFRKDFSSYNREKTGKYRSRRPKRWGGGEMKEGGREEGSLLPLTEKYEGTSIAKTASNPNQVKCSRSA